MSLLIHVRGLTREIRRLESRAAAILRKESPLARVTVEDCLECIPNRFALVVIASDRARQLSRGMPPLIECNNKPAVTSLREIAKGSVKFREDVKQTVVEYLEERRAAGFM